MDVAQLAAFLPIAWAGVPRALYFHENQLTYPEEGRANEALPTDTSWGFRNVMSCLAARSLAFNSRYHLNAFAAAAATLLERLPRPNPREELARRLKRARVLFPGVERESLPLGAGPPPKAPLQVLFNHRWEHDKDPAAFLAAVRAALDAGAELELTLLGERFGQLPPGVAEHLEALEPHLRHVGFAADREAYARRLGTCDVAVSTARHEFYGIALLEAVTAGCTPLAPERLAYPEVLAALGPEALYRDAHDLSERLVQASRQREVLRRSSWRRRQRDAVADHTTERAARDLDDWLAEVAGAAGAGGPEEKRPPAPAPAR